MRYGREQGTDAAAGRAGRGGDAAAGRPRTRRRIDDQASDSPEDFGDAGLPLTEEANDEAVAGQLRERLDAIDRALARLEAGTYGRSVLSGKPIPDQRLEADPAAELTVEEARAAR